MSYSKAQIYNLALSMLLLQRQIANPDTDTTNENKVLNTNWDTAFLTTLEDLDLDSTSTQKKLTLLTTFPVDYPEWKFVYTYPANCAFFRRIKSVVVKDDRYTRIPLKIAMYTDVDGTRKSVFTNEEEATCEMIPTDLLLSSLNSSTALAIAAKLAYLSSPLIVGKGADKLKVELERRYVSFKAEAQETDARENFNYEEDDVQSEFVKARLS